MALGPRLAAGDLASHALNSRADRLPLFETPAHSIAFGKIQAVAHWPTHFRFTMHGLMPDRQDVKLTVWLSDWLRKCPRDWVAWMDRSQAASERETLPMCATRTPIRW